ncbi:hypothetical protein [Micromonospora sp. WMMD998]|uniref:hypothetical protein n=1 Tax=Micromonospora sp. WMMD998 TaxID=3016092 RepID=UPI00249A3FFB|nr:hypothetical protein [Micromonospora sp. WMMD998]WFE40475.1 hypothetical protein O7619_19330 [Micromonospora sp. WMMD998]
MSPASRRRLLAAGVAVLLTLTGCGGQRPPGPADREQPRYGYAPAPDPDVTLQPDVVVVGGGSDAVRSVSADGLTWRLDPSARHAGRLAPGRVMFLTGRGVGRVLDLAEEGGDLRVTIGPVTLTEVIRDGVFTGSDVPVDRPTVYSAGDPAWAREPAAAGGTLGRAGPVRAPAVPPGQPPPAAGGRAEATAHGYRVRTFCCAGGIGAHFTYDDGGVRLAGTVTLTVGRPDASFHLAIGAGRVTRAELEITGGFGIKVDFTAGIDGGRNHHRTFPIPVDIAVPIGLVAGIPLSFTVTQTLEVATAFGARSGTVRGAGEYALAGRLGFGWADGRVGPRVTEGFARRASLLDSLTGVPVGVMGLVIRHGVRFTVGISAFLFTAGIWFELTTSYGTTLGSALGAPYALCRGVGLGVRARFGVGYRILEPVVRVLNTFLSLLSPSRAARIPQVAAAAGPSWGADVYRNEEVVPDVAVCGHPPG